MHDKAFMEKKEKVLVAMSGGVDSSVAAALLKQQGYFVTGGFMKNFSTESWQGVIEPNCPWQQDWEDVQDVCKLLGIEARAFNFEREYAERVIEYFFSEYEQGRTPNPDVMCNKEIKFRMFLDKARDLGFDYIATGHYARISSSQSLRGSAKQSLIDRFGQSPRDDRIKYQLLKGVDRNKDQSYFLYTLNQDQLARSLFPLGSMTKEQVREKARELGLPNAAKKDSQGICFVGEVNLVEFLKQRIPVKTGEVVTTNGEVVGKHENAAYYTVGQRHGFGIGGIGPFYMVNRDLDQNKVIVTNQHDDKQLYSQGLKVKDIHWIDPETEKRLPLNVKAQHRYRQSDQKCKIHKIDGGYQVEFTKPQRAITPGQSVVFYDDDTVLGGGIIDH